jgi:outer membrane protein
MKHLRTLILIAVLTVGFNSVQAQLKVAHIDTQALIALMPETKAMQAELEKLAGTYQTEIQTMQTEIQAKATKYTQEGPSQTDEINRKRQLELEQDQQNFMQAQRAADEDLRGKRDELLQPIFAKAKEAIEAVATADGITYVLEGASLIVANGTDLLPAVKTKLGLP